jgi:hypothetical protein
VFLDEEAQAVDDKKPSTPIQFGTEGAVRTGLEPATSAVTGQHSEPTELPDRGD